MRIGVLGLGFMGSTHLQALADIPGAQLAAVMDADERRLSGDLGGIQGNLGGPGRQMDFSGAARYRTVDEILADARLDAVDICLPTHLHAPIAIQALRAGKHVLVEKPMALDGAAADAICEEAARSGRILMAAQVVRFIPAYRELARLVKSGQLGAVRWAIFRRRTSVPTWGPWEFDKAKSGGGVFDLLIHDVDMALDLFGAPEAVAASGYEDMPRGIDMITAELRFKSCGSVTITGGWHHVGEYPFSMEYTVVADGGVVEFSSAGRPATLYRADGRKELLPDDGADCYRAEIEYFVRCCEKGEQPALCMPAESAEAVKVARRMVEAREKRGAAAH
jgi:predicted dehydrogenase